MQNHTQSPAVEEEPGVAPEPERRNPPYYELAYEDENFAVHEECFDTRAEAEARRAEVEARILAACGTLDRHEQFYISTCYGGGWLRRKLVKETRLAIAAERKGVGQ